MSEGNKPSENNEREQFNDQEYENAVISSSPLGDVRHAFENYDLMKDILDKDK
ncbi:hypothetical protein ACSJL4_001970 [Serratia nematodiphila]|nr:hypothetical protein SMKC034_12660 [Serratia marcescens]